MDTLWHIFLFFGAVILILAWLAWAAANYVMEPYQPFSTIPLAPLEPPKPKITRDFGKHFDPITSQSCGAIFELLDARELAGNKQEQCWQCPKCKLLRFEFEVKAEVRI